MYKDKDKQREAQREWVRQKRAAKGSTEQGSTLVGHDVLNPITKLCIESQPKTTRLPTHKRGKDIKCFEDLPVDVQQTINRTSMTEGKINQTIKALRTTLAIRYQHLKPNRYYSANDYYGASYPEHLRKEKKGVAL